MGTRLTFLDQEVVTDFESRTDLLDCLCGLGVPHPSPLSYDLGTLAGGQGFFPLHDGR